MCLPPRDPGRQGSWAPAVSGQRYHGGSFGLCAVTCAAEHGSVQVAHRRRLPPPRNFVSLRVGHTLPVDRKLKYSVFVTGSFIPCPVSSFCEAEPECNVSPLSPPGPHPLPCPRPRGVAGTPRSLPGLGLLPGPSATLPLLTPVQVTLPPGHRLTFLARGLGAAVSPLLVCKLLSLASVFDRHLQLPVWRPVCQSCFP